MEDRHESTDYSAKGPAFWLEVTGDSMTAPAGVRPSIPEGSLVLVDTGIEPTPGKLVVAQLDESNEATFKKLIVDGGQKFLKPLNPAYPLIPIKGNCRIIGVAVEAKTKL
jgi:SOS-response transcriptional repressor LexA